MLDAVNDKRQVTIVGDVAQKILIARKFIGWNKVNFDKKFFSY